MANDTDQVDAAAGSGTTPNNTSEPKKFLYKGPQGRKDSFENEIPSMSSKPNLQYGNIAQTSSSSLSGYNSSSLHNAWSKNVSAHHSPTKPGYQDGWNKSADTGFYSRHGGLDSLSPKNSKESVQISSTNIEGSVQGSNSKAWHGSSNQAHTRAGPHKGGIDPLSAPDMLEDPPTPSPNSTRFSHQALNNNNATQPRRYGYARNTGGSNDAPGQ